MRAVVAAVSLIAFAGVVRPQQPVPASNGGTPKALALLVGIDKYPEASGFPALKGARNDMERARAVLEQRFGFASASIVELMDEHATHENIVRAIKTHLIDKAGPDTHVVLWFSGHGSRVPDASGNDSSPIEFSESVSDETFVAWDSRLGGKSGNYDISDDELFSLLAAVPSRNVVMVADCCHSSGLLRGGPRAGVREAPIGTLPVDSTLTKDFWPNGLAWRDDDNWRETLPNLVFVAACGSAQEAGEIEIEGRTFGTLTWYLSQVLLNAPKDASWEAVVAETRAFAAGVGTRHQIVEAGGAVERPIFGGAGVDVPRGYYQVDWFGDRQGKELLVGAGHLHGIGTGAELDVFDFGGKQVGSARVTKVTAVSCNAVWEGADKPPLGALRAYPKSLGESANRRTVFLADGVDRSLVDSPVVQIVADRAAAEYELRSGADGLQLWQLGKCVRTMKATADAVRLALLKEHQFRSLWEGVASPGQFRIEVAVQQATPAEIEKMRVKQPPAALHDATGGIGSATATVVTTRYQGQNAGGGYVKLVITNRSEERLHIALVSASQDREVNVLYGKTSDNAVDSGSAVERLVWVGVGETWPENEPMTDRYVVVATRRYADFKPFAADAPAITRGGDTAELPPFLRETLGGTRTRGDTDVGTWGIALCELQMVTPQHFEECRRAAASAAASRNAKK